MGGRPAPGRSRAWGRLGASALCAAGAAWFVPLGACGKPPVSGPGPRELGFCEVLQRSIGGSSLGGGFECLAAPNAVTTGFFGPRDSPNRATFATSCFADAEGAKTRLALVTRETVSLSVRHSVEHRVGAAGQLELGFLGGWAPTVGLGAGVEESVLVTVELKDAEIRVLPDVGARLQRLLGVTPPGPERQALETCLAELCDPGRGLHYPVEVLAAEPWLRVETRTRSTERATLGTPGIGFQLLQDSSRFGVLELRGAQKLNFAVRLERAADALRPTACRQLQRDGARREALARLEALARQISSERDLARIPEEQESARRAVMAGEGLNDPERSALLELLELLLGAAAELALPAVTGRACDLEQRAERIVQNDVSAGDVRRVLSEAGPLGRVLRRRANDAALPCADPLWFEDRDGDGEGNPRRSVRSRVAPEGYVENARDCYDENRDVHSRQTAWFARHRGDGSFDYDCDGENEPRDGRTSQGCVPEYTLGVTTSCVADPGWVQEPGCGERGEWLEECDTRRLRCVQKRKSERVKECR